MVFHISYEVKSYLGRWKAGLRGPPTGTLTQRERADPSGRRSGRGQSWPSGPVDGFFTMWYPAHDRCLSVSAWDNRGSVQGFVVIFSTHQDKARPIPAFFARASPERSRRGGSR